MECETFYRLLSCVKGGRKSCEKNLHVYSHYMNMKIAPTDPCQAIADPSRREILHLLSKEKRTINALAENFEMSRPAVSKHIKILTNAGFIRIDDIGRERFCYLKPDGFDALQNWINYYKQFWSGKLSALENFLNETNTVQKKPKKVKRS